MREIHESTACVVRVNGKNNAASVSDSVPSGNASPNAVILQ